MELQAASTLITGASGNVGTEVVRLLREQNHPVRTAVRNLDATKTESDGLSTPVLFDFMRPETWRPALTGIEQVFLVRPPAISDTKRYINPVIDFARELGVRKVVFLSLLGAERIPVVPHRRIEKHLEASGLPHTFLRASFFMQNLSTTHQDEIRDEDVIAVPAGQGKTSFIDARDVAAVAAKVLADPRPMNRWYDLTGSEALDYGQVAEILTDVLGRPIAYANPSLRTFFQRMRAAGHPLGFVLVTSMIYTTARLGMAGRVTPETAELLGRPPISMRQFVADYADCWT
jgi:uncharacterized protein YbjT (DUF2867 family)